MSSFGTGSVDTTGTLTTLSTYSGTDGAQAGSDGLVPGPAVGQAGYLLGAGGDWTLEVLGGININDSTDRVATTQFVQQVVGNAALGGNANLGALGDVNLVGLADAQFLQYNAGALKWENVTLSLGVLSDVNLAGLADGNTIVWDAVNGEWVPGVGGGGGGGAANLDDLGDVTIAGVALNHFLVNDGAGQFANRLISSADLSDTANIALLNANQTFTGNVNVGTQGAGNNTTLVASTAFVQQEITALNLGTASQSNVGDFLASNSGLNNLSDVTLNGPVAGHFLVHDGADFKNRIISSADLSDTANIALLNQAQTFSADVIFTADVDLLNAIVDVPTQGAGNNTTLAASTAFVQQEITALNLGTASQSDAGDFLASNASIADLSDVNALVGIQNGDVLAWVAANNRFEFTAPAVTYTDEEARNASGTALANGAHTGISFVNNDAGNTIDATVSLAGFSVNALSDVDTVTNAPNVGEVLKWDGNNFVPSSDTSKTQEEIEDIVGGMVSGNTETGITVTYQDNAGLAGKLDFEVDNTVVGFLAGAQTFTGDKTFTGAVDLTAATATASTQAVNDNTTAVATTAFVINEIADLDLANTYQGLNARLTDISGLLPTNNNFIVGDGNNFVLETPSDVITSLGLGVAQDDLLIGTGANTFGTIATTAGSRSFLASSAGAGDLSDVTLGGVVLGAGQVLRYDGGGWVNAQLALSDLSGIASLVKTDANATFGAFAYDFTASTVTALTQANADNSTKVATTEFVKNVVAQVGNVSDLTDLTDVTLGGVALAEGQILRVSADNQTFVNAVLDLSDLSGLDLTGFNATGQVLSWDNVNSEFVAADPAETAQDAINDLFITNNPAHAGISFVYDDNANTLTATVADQAISQLTDVTLGALVDGQVLRYDGVNGDFRNLALGYGDLTGTPVIGVDVQGYDATLDALAGVVTAADKLVYADGVDSFATTDLTANARTFLGTQAGLNDLSDVSTAGFADAHMIIYDGTADNRWESVAISGDVTISNTGVTSISAGVIVDNDISAVANIAVSKLASSDITIGTTAITLGNASTTLAGMTGIDFANQNASIGASMTTNLGNPTELTLGGAGSQVNISGSLDIAGDLTVGGTTTTINTTNLDVSDQIISLNNGVANANTTDIGLFLDRGTLNPALIFWDEGSDVFKMATHLGAVDSTTTDFTGAPGLTLAPLQVSTPVAGNNSDLVATTAWVQNEIANLANALDDLTDVTLGLDNGNGVALADRQTLVYDAVNGVFRNEILSSSDLSDTANISLLNANQTLSGDKTFTGAVDLTGATPTAATLAVNDNSTALATTAYVEDQIDNDINALNLPATYQSLDATLTALAGVATVANKLIYANGADSFVTTDLTAEARTFLASTVTSDDLNDVTLGLDNGNGVALADRQTLVYDNVDGVFRNEILASADLSDTANISLLDANQTLSGNKTFTGDVDLTAATATASTQAVNDNTTALATTAFVINEIADLDLANTYQGLNARLTDISGLAPTNNNFIVGDGNNFVLETPAQVIASLGLGAIYQPLDATLTALAGVVTAADKLIYANGADSFVTTDLTANARTFLGSSAGLSDLTDVTLGLDNGNGVALADRHVLFYDNANGVFRNEVLSSSDLSDTANISLLNANQTLSGDKTFTGAVNLTGATATAATQAVNNNTNALATTAYVEDQIDNDINALDLANTYQAKNDRLTDISGLLPTDNNFIVGDGNNFVLETPAQVVASLGLGALYQPLDATLTALAGVVTAADKLVYSNGADSFTTTDLTGFARNLLDDADATTAKATLEIETTEDGGLADAGKFVVTDNAGALGALDGSNLTALGSVGTHSDVDLTGLQGGQGLVYSALNQRFEPGTVPTTGTDVNETPTVTAQSISLNPNALVGGDFVIYGRVMEVIDYGSVAEAFGAGDFALDFGSLTDSVIYADEDYGVLVV